MKRLVAAGVDVAQKNDAGCGFAHWLACAPRSAGDTYNRSRRGSPRGSVLLR